MKIKILKIGELETNCYLLINNNQAIIIDPGDGEIEKIFNELADLQLIKIILTHYHFDHVINSDKLRQKTGAKVLIHEAEKNYIDFTADDYLKDGDIISFGNEKLKIINTPGHTKGSICLLNNDMIFTGDTLFKDGYGRTDFPGGSVLEMKQSLFRLKELIKKGMIVYPGHGDNFKQP